MFLNIPTAIWFGFATIISLFITIALGTSMHFFKKDVFRYHTFFAFLTGSLAAIHFVLAVLLWFYGIVF